MAGRSDSDDASSAAELPHQREETLEPGARTVKKSHPSGKELNTGAPPVRVAAELQGTIRRADRERAEVRMRVLPRCAECCFPLLTSVLARLSCMEPLALEAAAIARCWGVIALA
jgi:hypothetical protein